MKIYIRLAKLHQRSKDLHNRSFGRLVVLYPVRVLSTSRFQWLCRCNCGRLVSVTPYNLLGGYTKSCGCLQKELTVERSLRGVNTYKVKDNIAVLTLVGYDDTIRGYTKVDIADLSSVLQYRWCLSSGYAVSGGYGTPLKLHRLLMSPIPTGYEVDHRDGDTLNNCRDNLRVCTHAENSRNHTSVVAVSGYKGVYATSRGKWLAHLCIDGESLNLGTYASKASAAKAYNVAATKYHGDFAYLNSIS